MVSEAVYVALVAGSSAVAVAGATWLWRTNREYTARLFVALILVHAVTGVLVVAELLAPSRALAVRLYDVQTAVGGAITPLWFLFVLAYVGYRRRITRPVVGIVGGWYVILATAELTNAVHNLVWSEYVVESAPFPYVVGEPTVVSVALTFPQGLLYYAGLGLLGWHFLFGSASRRTQTAALFVGYLPPLFVISAWLAGALPGPMNGALVIASTWTLTLAAWAAFRHQLFDLVPMARETVFSSLEDAVLVVDGRRRVLDYNRAAAETFPGVADCKGEPVETALPELLAEDAATRVTATERPLDPDADVPAAGDVTVLDADGDGDRSTDGASDGNGSGDGEGADGDGTDAPDLGFADTFRYYHEAGPREYSVSVTPLRAGGSVEGYALVLRDVTDREHQVRALERQTAQLERLVSTLSHDLRNPLNVAHGRVQLARDSPDDEHLDKAGDALDRMEEIVDDTLTLAREGQAIDDRERVSLADLAGRAWNTTDTGDATFVVDPEADVDVYADPSRLRSVFENLFRNAVEHASPDRNATPAIDGAAASDAGSDAAAAGDVGNDAAAAGDAGRDAADDTGADANDVTGRNGSGDAGGVADGPTAGTPPDDAAAGENAAPLVRGGSSADADDGRGDTGSDEVASDDGPAGLTVTLGRRPGGFYVEDDGPGVPPDERDKVFEYEFTTAEGGTGLGLAIVDAIARAHGWSVEMTDGTDGGARVEFSGVDVLDADSAQST